jgi:hypothetical protein
MEVIISRLDRVVLMEEYRDDDVTLCLYVGSDGTYMAADVEGHGEAFDKEIKGLIGVGFVNADLEELKEEFADLNVLYV